MAALSTPISGLAMTLSVLQRRDNTITRVVDKATSATLYEFDQATKQWAATSDVTEYVTPDVQFQQAAGAIYGIWFYSPEERERIGNLLMRAPAQAPAAHPYHPGQQNGGGAPTMNGPPMVQGFGANPYPMAYVPQNTMGMMHGHFAAPGMMPQPGVPYHGPAPGVALVAPIPSGGHTAAPPAGTKVDVMEMMKKAAQDHQQRVASGAQSTFAGANPAAALPHPASPAQPRPPGPIPQQQLQSHSSFEDPAILQASSAKPSAADKTSVQRQLFPSDNSAAASGILPTPINGVNNSISETDANSDPADLLGTILGRALKTLTTAEAPNPAEDVLLSPLDLQAAARRNSAEAAGAPFRSKKPLTKDELRQILISKLTTDDTFVNNLFRDYTRRWKQQHSQQQAPLTRPLLPQ
ncbi:hypothetical protein CAOG_003755 [Capsaspora owczarzaki ATCC 30864]|uniref:Uncharacterized protein n=1 Tax=Capsaspora owczarzaki (strain ATCC 30864) TaxID=595528 RepID=A0A0D2X2N4_CAPO3|nr:hypothetical protein CAOG_003755 [Capsaspora owczarzaki ATCC 30864]